MRHPIITLTSDFGLKDTYVAEMKAVILSINPEATIVDITHEVEKFDVLMGAYVLASASPYFPEDTVHVAVVDPQVGTTRRAILVQTKRSFLIGPDNGVLSLTAANQGIKRVYEITNRKLMMPEVSHTFHGRDVFAPAAAHLSRGTPPEEFGPKVKRIATPRYAQITRRKDMVEGEVIHIDGFGNVITNFRENDLEFTKAKEEVSVRFRSTPVTMKLCKSYAEAGRHQPLAIFGSHGFLEISLNEASAAERFGVRSGDKVHLCA